MSNTARFNLAEREQVLIAKWRDKAARYVSGESSASEFGRCETWANCADELETVLADGERAQKEPQDLLGTRASGAAEHPPSMPKDDPIVGHSTFSDGHHEPLRQSEAAAIIAASDAAKDRRVQQMPDERTAIDAMFQAWLRLKELGWKESQYCPKDGSRFDVIEPGSTGIHRCRYEGEWPKGTWWIEGDGDLWPSSPVLFRRRDVDSGQGNQSEAEQPSNASVFSGEGERAPTEQAQLRELIAPHEKADDDY